MGQVLSESLAAPEVYDSGAGENLPRQLVLPPVPPLQTCFSAWCNAIGPVFDIAVPEAEREGFAGEVQLAGTAKILLSRITCSSARLLRSAETMARCNAGHFCLWLVERGSLSGRVQGRRIEAAAGDVLVLDLRQSLDLQTSNPGAVTECIGLWLPRPRLLAAVTHESALHGLVLRGTAASGRLLGVNLRALAANVPGMSAAELDTLARGVIELAVQALRATLAGGAAVPGVPLGSFTIIRRFIDANIALPELGVDMLAQKFGLSRSSLYRLFEPVGGIAAYIRQQRLQLAYQEIVAPETANHRLGQISYRLGFRDFSAFCRTFRAHFGISPRAARNAALAEGQVEVVSGAGGEESLAGWLMGVG